MSRQERRRRLRQTGPKFRWDMIIVYAVLAFFTATALFSYFVPQINARAYASSPRVQKIIINRAIANVGQKSPLEFTYSYSAADAEDPVQYQVKEAGDMVTLIDSKDKESTEYAANAVPDKYRTVPAILADVKAALKNKDFKIIHPESDNSGYYSLQVVHQITATELEGYNLYFTAEHALDVVHYYKTVGKDEIIQRVYNGLITGIIESKEPTDP
ncbi:MAG: hypothetical protein FD169_847 [Bacillota bacterium]|nr:MAG: hypothetical protein FD169_847 [Bacillota bacterium]MBS3950103.1 hypothetical protein [Peptococcaceae bacterium]